MEMHQVRYFLATVNELNFTKAAERCNVTQPSLTRAIKQLEDEFGGELFRRERPQAQLTELGQRMYPLLKQCYDSALGARALASAIKNQEVGTLKLALSRTIGLDLIIAQLAELNRLFTGLEMKLLRGSAPEIVELLKAGEAELAIAGELGGTWDRLDRWPLFSEDFGLLVNARHPLAGRSSIEVGDLGQERWLRRPYCELAATTASLIRGYNLDPDQGHEPSSDGDLITLLEADLGVALAPRSIKHPATLKHVPVRGIELCRTVYLYGVAGRQRTAAAAGILKMLRAADWTRTTD
jgi:DNA-binding transcriptional LysR family regulator